MHNEPIQTGARQSGGPQLREAFEHLVQIVLDGLRHGHFRCVISSDARQIVENVTGFFSILHEWSKANDNRESSAATGSGEARRDR